MRIASFLWLLPLALTSRYFNEPFIFDNFIGRMLASFVTFIAVALTIVWVFTIGLVLGIIGIIIEEVVYWITGERECETINYRE